MDDRPAGTRGPWARAEVSVVIPTFNEARRIGGTIEAIRRYVGTRTMFAEIIVSDDGSTDATCQIVRQELGGHPPVRLLEGLRNRGKGHAVRRGVLASRGDLVLTTDADLATPIGEMSKLLDAVHAGADIAIGSRALPGSCIMIRQPAYRELMGKAFNRLVQALVLPGLWDTQCGFKLLQGGIARRLFSRCAVDGFAYDVEVLALAVRAGYVVVEVPVQWAHVAHSQVRLGRDSIGMLLDLMKIAWRVRALGAGLPANSVEDAPRRS